MMMRSTIGVARGLMCYQVSGTMLGTGMMNDEHSQMVTDLKEGMMQVKSQLSHLLAKRPQVI